MMKQIVLVLLAVLLFAAGGTAKENQSIQVGDSHLQKSVWNQNTIQTEAFSEPTGDITLEWSLKAAVDRHPTIKAALYAIEASHGAVLQAGVLPNPQLFGEIEDFGGSGDFSGTGSISGTIGISQELILGGKIEKGLKEKKAEAKMVELELKQEIIGLKTDVEKQFVEVFILQEQLKFQEEQVALLEKTHDVVAKRVKVGDTTPLDLSRSLVELTTEAVQLNQARQAFNTARYALAATWGSESPQFSKVRWTDRSLADLEEPELTKLLEESPSWLVYEIEKETADAALELAKAQRIPDLEIEGGVQYFNDSNDHAFFFGVSIPLLLFDKNRGGIAEAGALLKKAEQESLSGQLNLKAQLRERVQNLKTARNASRTVKKDIIPLSRNAFDAVSKSYKAGETDILELLDAQRQWIDARMTLLDLVRDLEMSRVEIRQLTGEGIDSFYKNIQKHQLQQ